MKGKILYIEDDAINMQLVKRIVTPMGYELIEAENGEEGVQRAEEHKPDLILMDMHMPGVDGFEATKRIKAKPELAHIPIIAFTAHFSSDQCNLAGCDGFIAKPLSDVKEFMAKIELLFSQLDAEGRLKTV